MEEKVTYLPWEYEDQSSDSQKAHKTRWVGLQAVPCNPDAQFADRRPWSKLTRQTGCTGKLYVRGRPCLDIQVESNSGRDPRSTAGLYTYIQTLACAPPTHKYYTHVYIVPQKEMGQFNTTGRCLGTLTVSHALRDRWAPQTLGRIQTFQKSQHHEKLMGKANKKD